MVLFGKIAACSSKHPKMVALKSCHNDNKIREKSILSKKHLLPLNMLQPTMKNPINIRGGCILWLLLYCIDLL